MEEEVVFEQFVSQGCGLEVHKKEIVATIRYIGLQTTTRKFGATTRSLTEIKDLLIENVVS